jgi:hypothetical protein
MWMSKYDGLLILAIVMGNVLIWTGLYGTDGTIIQRDFNFPLNNDNFEKNYYPLWNDLTSQSNIERFPRIPLMSPFLMLSHIGLEMDWITKILIVSSFTFLTFAVYLFVKQLLKFLNYDLKKHRYVLVIGAFIAAYNPVNLQFLGGITFLISLAALPLLLYIILTYLNKSYSPLLISGALFLSLAHPFLFIMNLLTALIFGILVYNKEPRLLLNKATLSVVTFVLLFSWFLIPYYYFPTTSIELGRENQLDRQTYESISDNQVFRIFLLERDAFEYVETASPESSRLVLHYLALGTLVCVALSWFLYLNKRLQWEIPLFFTIGFVICFLLSLGSNGPLNDYYYSFISDNPYGWIFRSPLKFQLYQGLFISILFIISIFMLGRKIKKDTILVPFLLMFVFIGSSTYGIFYASTISFNPISIPNEYSEINELLRNVALQNNSTSKVIYYPLYGETPTSWSEGHLISPFDSRSSTVPTYDMFTNYNYVRDYLYDLSYLKNNLNNSQYYDFLNSVGIQYIIFHNDRTRERDSTLDEINLNYLQSSSKLDKIYDKNGWYVFTIINSSQTSPIRTLDAVTLTNNSQQVYEFAHPTVGTLEFDSASQRISSDRSEPPIHQTSGLPSDISANRSTVSTLQGTNLTYVQSYAKISPVEWRILLNESKQPFILAFSETFDQGWVAKNSNGTTLSSLPLYGMINGFYIDNPNFSELTIRYEPQTLSRIGLTVSGLFLLGYVSSLAISALVKNRKRNSIKIC